MILPMIINRYGGKQTILILGAPTVALHLPHGQTHCTVDFKERPHYAETVKTGTGARVRE